MSTNIQQLGKHPSIEGGPKVRGAVTEAPGLGTEFTLDHEHVLHPPLRQPLVVIHDTLGEEEEPRVFVLFW